jgi:hypothetical protein
MNERVEGNSIPFCQGPNSDACTPIHSTRQRLGTATRTSSGSG